MPSTVLGAEDTAVKKTDEVLASRNIWSKWRERDNITSGCNMLLYALERKIKHGRRIGVMDVCYFAYIGQAQPL